MALILHGTSVPTPRFTSKTYLDDPRYGLTNDKGLRPSGSWIRGIVIHTTRGTHPQPIRPGHGNPGGAAANVGYWNHSPACASSHLLVDSDGTVIQTCDLITYQTWHATSVNPVTVGIEVVQGSDGSLYQDQITTVVALVDLLTAALGIQRQIPTAYSGPIDRLVHGGHDVVGIYGHRDQSADRGRGDPGDAIFDALALAGYERMDFKTGQDLTCWKDRQKFLGLTDLDGVPGPATVKALQSKNYRDGIWVQRS